MSVPAAGPAPGQLWCGPRDWCGHMALLDAGCPPPVGTSPSAARAPRPGHGAVPVSLPFLAELCFCCVMVFCVFLCGKLRIHRLLKRPFQRPAFERPSTCCLHRAVAGLPWA